MIILKCYRKINCTIYIIAILLFCLFNLGYSQTKSPDYLKADEYFQLQDYNKALKYYNKVLTADPDNYDVNLKIARCYFKTDQYQDADSYYQKVLSYYELVDPSVFNLSNMATCK
jgi:tetratricopeptide (TPR) repeat protein